MNCLNPAAMSFPHEDNNHANSLHEVRGFLEARHPSQYLVFNLSGHSYDTAQLNNQVCSMMSSQSIHVHEHCVQEHVRSSISSYFITSGPQNGMHCKWRGAGLLPVVYCLDCSYKQD